MDPAFGTTSPDKPSFRKPSTDAANRKYRRHSPVKESDSSSSDGSPKRKRSHSPLDLRKDRSRMSDDHRKKDVERDTERGPKIDRPRDSRLSERHSHGSSRDSRRYDDYSRHHKYEDEKNYQKSSRSGRDSRYDGHFEYSKSSRLIGFGSRQVSSSRDSDRYMEQDRYRGRDSYTERRDRPRSPGDRQNDHIVSHEELKGYDRDISRVTGGARRSKGNDKSIYKDVDGRNDQILKRKHDDSEGDKFKDKYLRERDEGKHSERRSMFSNQETDGRKDTCLDKTSKFSYNEEPSSRKPTSDHLDVGNVMENKNSSSDKNIHETSNSEVISSTNNDESANTVDAAKVAALKAAELVNKNLVGFGGVGCMSTDQKKKLLWGSKKATVTEEPSNRWDLNVFDKDRQEKFNKLMSLRLPWCLWPIVGCEGQFSNRTHEQSRGWKPPGQEAGGTGDRPGETIYSWTAAQRWPDSRSWPVIRTNCCLSSYFRKVYTEKVYKLFICPRLNVSLLLNCLEFLENIQVLESSPSLRLMSFSASMTFLFGGLQVVWVGTKSGWYLSSVFCLLSSYIRFCLQYLSGI